MTELFTDLYERATKKEAFSSLYEVITSRENILLAYRTMKSNKGSKTPGTDGKTISDIQKLSDEELVSEIQTKLQNYRPKKVRRKLIEKDNGKLRPSEFLVSWIASFSNASSKYLNPLQKPSFTSIAMVSDPSGQHTMRWQGCNFLLIRHNCIMS